LTSPARLETTWYDGEGKELWRGTRGLPLPVVLEERRLVCNATECLTSRPLDDPSRLPPPESESAWLPERPGHYVVRLRLTGDQALDCRVDLDLVADEEEARRRSADDPFRWAMCVGGIPNPINDPGSRPFALSPPSVTLIDTRAAVDIAVTTRRDEELRGWFILAPPGSSQPWREAEYQSPVQQKLSAARVPTAFEWDVSVGDNVAPGVYGMTVWFHRRGETGWEHAAGGDIELAPVVVEEGGSLRWAGPVRIRLAEPPAPLRPGATSAIILAVSGVSSDSECLATWRLWHGDQMVATGNGGPCADLEVALPPAVPPGPYRLQIDAFANEGNQTRLSDGLSVHLPVLEPLSRSGPR
jgi:hypothetical protein